MLDVPQGGGALSQGEGRPNCRRTVKHGGNCGASPRRPPAAGRQSGLALEGAVERGLRFVADVGGDAGDAVVAAAQPIGGELKAPARHVVDRRPAEQRLEAFRKHRARGAGFTREVVGGPFARRLGVHQRQRAADDRVVERREPSLAAARQPADVPAQHLDEQQLHHPAEHHLRAGRRRVDQGNDLPHGRGHQRADLPVAGLLDQHMRQRPEYRREEEFGQFEIAADEPRFLAAAAIVDRQHPFDRRRPDNVRRERKLRGLVAPEPVFGREREQEDIAGGQLALRAAGVFERAASGRDQVEDADVAQPGEGSTFVPARRADDAERGGERAAEEHRAGQPHGPQHLRQHIGHARGGAIRRSGKGRRCFGHCPGRGFGRNVRVPCGRTWAERGIV